MAQPPEFRTSLQTHKRTRKPRAWLGLIAAMGLLSFPTLGAAQPITGTYVSPGMGYVLTFEECADADATCVQIRNGAHRMKHATRASFMMPPHTGTGWRYQTLFTATGDMAGWMRVNDTGRIEVLGCRASDCTRMRWQKIERMAENLGNMAGL